MRHESDEDDDSNNKVSMRFHYAEMRAELRTITHDYVIEAESLKECKEGMEFLVELRNKLKAGEPKDETKRN